MPRRCPQICRNGKCLALPGATPHLLILASNPFSSRQKINQKFLWQETRHTLLFFKGLFPVKNKDAQYIRLAIFGLKLKHVLTCRYADPLMRFSKKDCSGIDAFCPPKLNNIITPSIAQVSQPVLVRGWVGQGQP